MKGNFLEAIVLSYSHPFVSALLELLSAPQGKTEKAGFDQSWEREKQIKVSISAWGIIWTAVSSVVLNLWFSDPWRAVSNGLERTQRTAVPIVSALKIIFRGSNRIRESSSLNWGVQKSTEGSGETNSLWIKPLQWMLFNVIKNDEDSKKRPESQEQPVKHNP